MERGKGGAVGYDTLGCSDRLVTVYLNGEISDAGLVAGIA